MVKSWFKWDYWLIISYLTYKFIGVSRVGCILEFRVDLIGLKNE